jgi:hypothetical protein
VQHLARFQMFRRMFTVSVKPRIFVPQTQEFLHPDSTCPPLTRPTNKKTPTGNSSKHLDQNLDLEQSKATIQPIQFDS